MKFKLFFTGFIATSLALFSGCSENPVSGKKDFSLISKQQEISMGAQGHKSILRQMKRYNDPRLQAYVNNIGQQLARQSHRKNIRYTFTVLEDPSVNAFALPGGYIYITTGLMAHLNSEGELAGVLGHEIAHVTARHGVKQQSAGMAGAILMSVLSKKTDVINKNQMSQMSRALLSGYGRDHELQADRLGAEYLARIGYKPQHMIEVVSVLKAQEEFDKFQARREGRQPRAYHGVFATHPRNDLRLQQVIAAANKYKTGKTRDPGHDRYLKMIDGIPFRISKNNYGRVIVGRASTPGLTYASLARRSKVDEQRLRLINGMFPKGQPVRGRLVKIIQ